MSSISKSTKIPKSRALHITFCYNFLLRQSLFGFSYLWFFSSRYSESRDYGRKALLLFMYLIDLLNTSLLDLSSKYLCRSTANATFSKTINSSFCGKDLSPVVNICHLSIHLKVSIQCKTMEANTDYTKMIHANL